MVSPLLSWFAGNARKLPWRDDPTAYHVWVSEIMLQQTRVEAVKPFYARFIGTLPDVKALAGCPEDQLLKLWEGLGYYNRVRNMQKAAQIVVESYDGKMPTDYGTLLFAAGNRKLYSRGGCIDRRWSGSTGSGWERPAGDQPDLRE